MACCGITINRLHCTVHEFTSTLSGYNQSPFSPQKVEKRVLKKDIDSGPDWRLRLWEPQQQFVLFLSFESKICRLSVAPQASCRLHRALLRSRGGERCDNVTHSRKKRINHLAETLMPDWLTRKDCQALDSPVLYCSFSDRDHAFFI
jgi:hypothetical protein